MLLYLYYYLNQSWISNLFWLYFLALWVFEEKREFAFKGNRLSLIFIETLNLLNSMIIADEWILGLSITSRNQASKHGVANSHFSRKRGRLFSKIEFYAFGFVFFKGRFVIQPKLRANLSGGCTLSDESVFYIPQWTKLKVIIDCNIPVDTTKSIIILETFLEKSKNTSFITL